MQRSTGWNTTRFGCAVALSVFLVSPVAADDVTVFAAASLRDAISGIAETYEAETGDTVTLVFAASSTLARQVVQGAPADVVLLADADWADWLVDEGGVEQVAAFAGNSLVMVALDGVPIDDSNSIPDHLSDGYIAMAQVDAVPAGRYGKAALVSLGLWETLEPRIVQANNVRAALRFVTSGEAAFGIGYASDLVAIPDLRKVYGFAEETHPPIVFSGGYVTDLGAPFFEYVRGDAGQEILSEWGFTPVTDQ
ncbi:molybdate ABC transporter substrate-binding protein [Octadecabacter sp. 1_MG-2023]|uniref:molybdate ABC transporter substrate-binding protein n=1 Tax=unclassified Octadecabacter TaxID=196158 RepID=UPI001C085FB8|nr:MULTISPECIES: molybdate ABC transporter substrate-binding protein [unclassified Octadecabacter]MBU2992041.1 molybdate ABC transporter substrate-binding protein [Octadecabacter sp. B2R22]MDO6736016.1 molybdate ABC transporter substrate-binding protein [Octadecabacter sp. 1_MG-2023]